MSYEQYKEMMESNPKWRSCERCDGKYLPSMTSHATKCGICAPLKFGCHSRVPRELKPLREHSLGPMRQISSDKKLPFGTNRCLCTGCGEYFGGATGFDMHRVGVGRDRRCLPPHQVSNKEGEALLRQNGAGYWVGTY